VSESENISNISERVIDGTRKGKDKAGKGKRSQSGISKRGKVKSRGREEEQSVSESVSNISQKVTIVTKKGKGKGAKGEVVGMKGKYPSTSKDQKYFSKKIVIIPAHEAEKLGKDVKYFSKNIVIEPSRRGYERTDYGKRTVSTGYRDLNVNIGTRRGRDYGSKYETHIARTASTDDKKAGKVMELLKGVQYFTKNIVIQPVPIKSKSGKKSPTYSEDISLNRFGKEKSDKFGSNNVVYSSGKQSKSSSNKKTEKRPWKGELRNGEDAYLGTATSDQDTLTESMLRAIEGFDENTKFYHKEITIQPVYIPPPKFHN